MMGFFSRILNILSLGTFGRLKAKEAILRDPHGWEQELLRAQERARKRGRVDAGRG